MSQDPKLLALTLNCKYLTYRVSPSTLSLIDIQLFTFSINKCIVLTIFSSPMFIYWPPEPIDCLTTLLVSMFVQIKLDIVPDKSWITDSLYVPPGYHFQSSITDEEPQSSKESPEVPYVYPAGIGSVMMNGCYGKNYSDTDPCYNSRARSTVCWVSAI